MRESTRRKHVRFDVTTESSFDTLLRFVEREDQAPLEFEEDLRALTSPSSGSIPVSLQIRRSTDRRRQEGSLRSQLLQFTTVMKRLGNRRLVLVHAFETISGGLLWRGGYLQPVVHDASSGAFSELWHLDSSRLGRMPAKQKAAYRDALEAHGVSVRNLSRPDQGNEFSEIQDFLEDKQASQEILDKARTAVERARDRHAERGLATGVPPYGYAIKLTNLETGAIEIVPRSKRFRTTQYQTSVRIPSDQVPGSEREPEVYRRMVAWALGETADGKLGHRTIAERLNEEGVPSPTGMLWEAKVVREVLENPVYAGHSSFFRSSAGAYRTLGKDGQVAPAAPKKRYRRPRDEWRIKKDTHEGLISPERWEALQAELASRSAEKGGKKRANQWTLRSPRIVPVLRCDHCSFAMSFQGRDQIMTCQGYTHYGTKVCQRYSIREREVAQVLWRAHAEDLGELLGTTNLGDRLRAKVRSLLEGRMSAEAGPAFDGKAARERVREIEAKVDAIARDLSPESAKLLDRQLKQLAAEKAALDRQLAEAKKPRVRVDPEAAVERAMGRLSVLMGPVDKTPRKDVREILDSIVRPDSLRLHFTRQLLRPGGKLHVTHLDRVTVDLIDPREFLETSLLGPRASRVGTAAGRGHGGSTIVASSAAPAAGGLRSRRGRSSSGRGNHSCSGFVRPSS